MEGARSHFSALNLALVICVCLSYLCLFLIVSICLCLSNSMYIDLRPKPLLQVFIFQSIEDLFSVGMKDS